MLLKAGDELNVLSETGMLHLVQDDNSEIVLTRQNTPFKIPESEPPSGIISNIAALFGEWLSQSPEDKVKTVTLASRGEAPLLISGTSEQENFLMAGLDSLVVYWSGGKPPYHIRMIDEDGSVVVEKNKIEKNNAALTDITIPTGSYSLEIRGDISSSTIPLTVVEPVEAPSLYNKILQSHAPITIKQNYATLALASHASWLFQALQLAVRYDLQSLKQNILDKQVPDSIEESHLN